jgi:hypothetical protein
MQRTVGGHVDQHGAVMAALAEGEVIDAEHLDLADVRLGQRPDQAQEGVLAHGDADRGRQAGSCPAGQSQPELRQHSMEQRRVSAVRSGQSGDLLGERHRRAGRVLAAEAAYT